MGELIFVTGGARSGKSHFAEKLAGEKDNTVYVATSIPFDEEMKRRIEIHRENRNKNWLTIEAFSNLDEALDPFIEKYDFILLDCITVMITNLMFEDISLDWNKISMEKAEEIERKIILEINKLLTILEKFRGKMIVVSNETGMGIVPGNPLSRHFRDFAGRANQIIAEKADQVFLVVSGIPVKIKG
jgi:adenosylcobinamide kinase / adenosylcobinamide-phosphate guanylyltransferase